MLEKWFFDAPFQDWLLIFFQESQTFVDKGTSSVRDGDINKPILIHLSSFDNSLYLKACAAVSMLISTMKSSCIPISKVHPNNIE